MLRTEALHKALLYRDYTVYRELWQEWLHLVPPLHGRASGRAFCTIYTSEVNSPNHTEIRS